MVVFPETKLFSGRIFRVKNEIQNWNPEFASHYGMPAGDHCGDATEMIGNGCRLTLPAPAPARRPAGLARPATGHGHGLRPGLPATDRPHGHGLRPRPTDTDGHGHGTPAAVKTWQSAGTVAAEIKQKSRQPVKGSRQGKAAGS